MPGVPQISHLWYTVPMALGLYVTRWTCENYLFAPLGSWLGLKNIPSKKAPPNEHLEKKYNSVKHWTHDDVKGLAKQLDTTEREIEVWLRIRKRQDKPTKLTKFCESAWRFTYYACAFTAGLVVLWDKPWLWDINECWAGFPNQLITDDIWYYYLGSMSFYVSLCFSQFFDIKRKDFWQMFIHHIVTIILIVHSWSTNCVRLGTLVLALHDCADIFLEVCTTSKLFTKMISYLKFRITDAFFGLFTVIWITTRIGVFPLWILRHTFFEAPKFPTLVVFNVFLSSLMVLHIFWTYLILRVAVRSLSAGRVENDIRESSEGSSD